MSKFLKIISRLTVLTALVLAPAVAFGQRPVNPIRVAITIPEENATNRAFYAHARAQLNKRRDVVVGSERADFDIFVAVTPINQKQTVIGYAAAVLVIIQENKAESPFRLYVEIGPTIEDLVERWMSRLDKQFFSKYTVSPKLVYR